MFSVIKMLNQNFYKWFGQSKIVDTNNEPMVMYHKSRSKEVFDEFRLDNVEKNGYNHHYGIYFVNVHYSHYVSYLGDGVEYYVYLKMENPFIIFDFNNQPQDMNGQKLIFIDVSKEYCDNLKRQGYDGIIIKSSNYDQYIVFEPSQVKSIDNNGEYKSETNNIFQ